VLKGRYFPNSDFWNAPKPRSASYTWRSILFGRELLAQGVQWGIGDGRTVRILKDFWVPQYPPALLKPISPIPDQATVHCLIDEETGTWISESVQAFFNPQAAAQIMQVPISGLVGEDYVFWPHTRHGTFSVRSAYNMARSEKFLKAQSRTKRGMASTWTVNEKDWKAIWKVKAPGKMNIHMWRFAQDCLPSCVQLVKRQIPANGSCIFCGRSEDISHSMLLCQFARTVWREVKRVVPLKLERKAFASNKNWLFDFLGRASDLQATTLTVGFWHIWEARNEARNSDVKPDPCRTRRKILAYIDLIKQNLFKPVSEHRCASISAATTWTPPPPDTVLVSSDAAIFKEAGCRGAGVILRDHHGAFVVGCRQHVVGLSSPELAEAVALRRAVQLARDEGMDKVIFETDCLSLVQRLNSSTMDRSAVGMLVAEIKASGRGFMSISFRHVKRVFNQAAHLLAKSSLDVNSSCVFFSVPEFIRGTFCIDVS
jgi:hypothetical protein